MSAGASLGSNVMILAQSSGKRALSVLYSTKPLLPCKCKGVRTHRRSVSQSINQSVTKDVRFGLPMVNPNAAPLEIGNAASSEHSPLTLQSEGGHFLSGYPALWALVTACLCKPFVLAERPDLGCEKPSREEP